MEKPLRGLQKELFEGKPVKGYILTDGICESENHVGTYRKILYVPTNELFCPCCEGIVRNQNLSRELTNSAYHFDDSEKKAYFKRNSIYGSKAFVGLGFNDFETPTIRERDALASVRTITKQIVEGQVRNVFMTGPAGSGKSMLAHAAASNINDFSAIYSRQLSVMFVDFTTLLELIIESYNNRATDKKTDSYYVDLMKTVDVLVIDDLAAESRLGTNKEASDHTMKILYRVINARDGLKSTIITTNLNYEQIKKIYDSRISSRLSKNLSVINFEGITDKRPSFY